MDKKYQNKGCERAILLQLIDQIAVQNRNKEMTTTGTRGNNIVKKYI